MKICIMLKHYDQHGGGVNVYTQNLLQELVKVDIENEYIFLYKNSKLLGTYQNYPNVKEICIESKSRIIWDQYIVPKIAEKEKCDVIFNPKYSIPLNTKIKSVFVCHGLDWYVMPWASKRIDRLNHKLLIPMYSKKATNIIAVSNTAREHMIKFLNVEESRVHTIYLGINENFKKIKTDEELEKTRKKYNLPERFLLYAGQIYPPKNFGRLIRAFNNVVSNIRIPLVVAGEHRWLCEDEIKLIDQLGISNWVIKTGWVEHNELSHLFSMAHAVLLPSLYEACPSPILEAMASGIPVLTSDRYGTKELAGEAGLLVNPENIDDISSGIFNIVSDNTLREKLITNGFKRIQNFGWKKCAIETLSILEKTVKFQVTKRHEMKNGNKNIPSY